MYYELHYVTMYIYIYIYIYIFNITTSEQYFTLEINV